MVRDDPRHVPEAHAAPQRQFLHTQQVVHVALVGPLITQRRQQAF
jgi:hypothetical protein